jgi:DNA-binding MarR family transcriptional regulator
MPEREEIHQSYYSIIPANVRYDKDLKDKAKLLYGEITALCNSKGYCWATNNYFAELYGVTKETISRLISNLAEKDYVRIEIIYENKQIIERRIYIVQAELVQKKEIINTPIDEKINTPIDENVNTPNDKKINTPIDEKIKDNITDINNTLFNNQSINQEKIDVMDEIEYEYIKKRIAKNIGLI